MSDSSSSTLSSTGSRLAWVWVGAQRTDRIADYHAAEASVTPLSMERICAALGPVANDSLKTVVVWGYAPGVLGLITSDPWLARKSYYWAVRPGEAKALIRDVEASGWMPDEPLRLHLCPEYGDLIEVFSTFGTNHGLVVLDSDEQAAEEIQRQRVRLGSRTSHGFERTLRDLHLQAQRLESPVEAVPLAKLRNLYHGRAALCVAAGPSLDRRLDFLREHQGDAVVIAADLIAHKVEMAGVRVDFIVSVDTGEAIIKRSHRPHNPDAIAVIPLAADRRMDALFPRRAFVWVEPTNSAVLDRATCDIPSGTNVGAAVVGMAIHLGCSEAVLVGHDLSFTIDRLYSDCVDQKQDLEDASLKAFRSRMQEVPGNGDKRVSTNTQFAMAAEDLGTMILLHPQVTFYNININDSSGALIRWAKPVPEGWKPPGLPRPATPPMEVLPLLIKRSFGDEMRAQCAEFSKIIFAALDAGRRLPEACAEAWAQAERLPWASHLSEPLLGGMELYCLNELTRPMDQCQPDLISEAAQVVRTCLPRWYALCERALHEELKRPKELDNQAKGTLVELFCAAPAPIRSSLQESLLPLYLSLWADLAEWMPDADPPLPARLAEAVTVVSRFGTQAPQNSLDRIMAMCAVDGAAISDTIIAQAREDKVIAPDRLIAAAALQPRPGPLGAAEAVLALREGLAGTDELELLRRAVVQPFARLAAVEAALRRAPHSRRAGLAVLAGLQDGWIKPDDAIIATCIELHPDTAAVIGVLEKLGLVTGERTRLAVARRYLAIGDASAALQELADVRPLSVIGVEARALACACLHRMGHPELVVEVLAGLPAQSLAARVIYRYGTLQRMPAERIVEMLENSGFTAIPADVLAACLDELLESDPSPAAIASMHRLAARALKAAEGEERKPHEQFGRALEEWAKLRATTVAG